MSDEKAPAPPKKNSKGKAVRAIKSGATFQNTNRSVFFSALEWKTRPFHNQPGENDFIIGTPLNPICRPLGKHVIQAPEKSFKTTFGKRLFSGMACGITLFPALPVNPKPRRILYTHGELSISELEDRTISALAGLPEDPQCGLNSLFEGRCLDAHLITATGQQALKEILDKIRPEIWVIDPWQEFIAGFDENSSKDTGLARKFIDDMIAEFGLTTFLMTHEGKDSAKGTRGHSSLGGWRDTLFRLKPHRQKDAHGVNRIVGVNIVVEPRWAEPPELFYAELQNGTLKAADIPKVVKFTARQLFFQYILGNFPAPNSANMMCGVTEIRKRTGTAKDEVAWKKLCDELIAEKRLEEPKPKLFRVLPFSKDEARAFSGLDYSK